MPKLILRTFSTDEHYNADCDLAFVDMTTEYARLLVERVNALHEIKHVDDSLLEMHYRRGASFYAMSTVDGDLADRAMDDAVEVGDDFQPDGEEERMGATWVVVADDGVSFYGNPEHADIDVFTDAISVDDLRRFAERPAPEVRP